MQSTRTGRLSRRIAAAAAGIAIILGATGALAQDYSSMSCYELWYARNAIYAENGYCFKTARARAVFGPGCFAPFGKLSGWEQREVSDIQYWERRYGC